MSLAGLVSVLNPAPFETLLGLCFLLCCCSTGSSGVHCSGSYSFRLVLLLFLEYWCFFFSLKIGASFPWRLLLFDANSCVSCLTLSPCSTHFSFVYCPLAPGKQLSVPVPECLQGFPASHGWVLPKGECWTHQQVWEYLLPMWHHPSSPAASCQGAGTHCTHSITHTPHVHAEPLTLPGGTETCPGVAPEPPRQVGSGCCTMGWGICKTGAAFPHRGGDAALMDSPLESPWVECALICVSLTLFAVIHCCD